MRKRTTTTIALAIGLGSGLAIAPMFHVEQPTPSQHVITIDEHYSYDFDAMPGDRLDVVLQPETLADGSPEQRCDDMGGRYRLDALRGIEVCEDVDF